jgi:hypothetical protein
LHILELYAGTVLLTLLNLFFSFSGFISHYLYYEHILPMITKYVLNYQFITIIFVAGSHFNDLV